jgi:hypothetical protein
LYQTMVAARPIRVILVSAYNQGLGYGFSSRINSC